MKISGNDLVGKVGNFLFHEFYCQSADAPAEHYFDDRLISILQKIRDYYTDKGFKIGIRINSTFRTYLGNILAGGVSNSPHKIGIAVDWCFVGEDSKRAFADFTLQMEGKKYLFKVLRSMGANGIGLYDTFFHIDTREKHNHPYFNSKDTYGDFSIWNKKKSDGLNEGENINDFLSETEGKKVWIFGGILVGLVLLLLVSSRR